MKLPLIFRRSLNLARNAALMAVVATAGMPIGNAHDAAEEMATAANNLLTALDEGQRDKATFELADDERKNWHFIPKDRNGLLMSEMNPGQRHLAHALLSSGMSNPGYAKAVGIMFLEQVLAEIENAPERRDPLKYYISIFGKPDAKGTWGWRVEGHHLSVNFTIVDGKQFSGTPSFFAGNPDEVLDGSKKGLQILEEEDKVALELLKSLNADQRKKATIAETSPKEIFTEANRKVTPLEEVGLPAGEMDDAQKEKLQALISVYIDRVRPELAADEHAKIKEAGFDKILFAWAGADERFKERYYRVQGPTFLIEYVNFQGKGNHSHTVWRDFNGDFGEDILGKHIREEHAEDK